MREAVMKIRRTAAIVWFFTKTIYLSPSNNPLFYLLIVIGGMFFFSGSLGKHETALLLLLAGITNRFMPTHQTRNNSDDLQEEGISQYSLLWPVGKYDVFIGYQLSGLIFILLLIIPCIYAGMHLEMPLMYESVCPPRTCVTNAPSGEPVVTVEEVIMQADSENVHRPYQLTIQVSHSLLFGFLSSAWDVVVAQQTISDSLFNELCPLPLQKVTPADIFDPTVERSPHAPYYSDFLAGLSNVYCKRLLYISCFVLLFFMMDGMAKYENTRLNKYNWLFKVVKYVYNAGYLLLCCLLIFDILLPESMISKMSLMLRNLGAFPHHAFLIILVAGMLWVLMYSIYIKIKG
jgi:hypothetical protein